MKKWLKITLIILGLLAWAAIVWWALPLVPWEPLSSFWLRFLLIALVFGIVGGIYGFKWWKRRKAARELEAAIRADESQSGDGKVLSDRMKEALDTLKRSSGKQSFLYELPWYVIIGPPGAGKTTALVNSGLKFPLAASGEAKAIAGVGGTRYCDWWFTEEAVLIDTAGRYTTQDSDAELDKKSWSSFLRLLKDHRPRQPINGVILAISLEDLVSLSNDELNDHANAIRKRLLELHQELKIDFPVYTLFTKADLIQGFREYFGNFTESRRRKVWGATFQTEDRTKNCVGQVPEEFDALVRRLTEELPDRLHEEADPIARIAIFGFPGQFATLRDRVSEFLNRIFEPSRYQANANLRGFYFSSGTQEGTPIDQVLGSMGRDFGAVGAADHFSGTGKSFFLHDLLMKVIFAESGWVSYDRNAVRRAAILRYGALGTIAAVCVAMLGLWGWSYVNNRGVIAATENTMAEYRVVADPELKRDTISDTDLEQIIGNLHMLRHMTVGYQNREKPVPRGETFGLAQRPRLTSAATTSYRHALERMLRSRLILRLERQIEAGMNDPEIVYTALKVYLMLGGKAPAVDKPLVTAYIRRDWEDNLFPGAANAEGRRALLSHLEAMLDLDRGQPPSFELNGPLVESAQRSLARMKIAERAYSLIQAAAASTDIEDYSVVSQGGADTALVFETIDGTPIEDLTVPGLYSYAGFHGFFLEQLGAVAETLQEDQWVLGDLADLQGVEEQFGRLGPELLDMYRKDFIEAWEKVLANLKFKPMSADKPQYIALAAASSPTSPIRLLFESIRDETTLTREQEGQDPLADVDALAQNEAAGEAGGEFARLAVRRIRDRQSEFARIGIDMALRKSQRRAGEIGGGGGGGGDRRIPGANIEAYFAPYHIMVEGEPGRRPVDTLVQNFYEVYQNLVLAATTPSQADRAMNNVQLAVVNLRANASRLPKSVAFMVDQAVNDFEGDAANTSIAQLNQMLTGTVTRVCQQVVENRYPFSRGSGRDVPLADFARLFAPNGTIDRFFATNLASMADISGETWTWKEDTRLGRELSKAALREFQRAAQIRDAFFPTGGSMPGVQITITPYTLSGDAEMALLDVNGTVLQTQQGAGNSPVTFTWPGGGGGSASVSLQPEIPGREPVKEKTGAWALMRLIDDGSVQRGGDEITARFLVGGREVSYKIQVGSIANPFFLPALSEFKCPTGL
ncbi:MAG: type VI secretion system membrane subunit TssM [Rhizobiaceae bacterium]|nr:type VI secretion system membrane subunit TssM [Rhizobiaceae bacterium]MCV0405797.1 type VI secretion system membrane subunit TssM [Rhizobiaceae bacterium]